MLILVTYDVSTVEKAGVRRLRRVAQACERFLNGFKQSLNLSLRSKGRSAD